MLRQKYFNDDLFVLGDGEHKRRKKAKANDLYHGQKRECINNNEHCFAEGCFVVFST